MNRANLCWNIENQLTDTENKVAGKIYESQVTVTSAELLALATTAKELVSAPGAGRLLEFVAAVIKHNAGTAYAEASAPDELVIEYGTGTDISAEIDATGFLTVTDDEIRFVPTNIGLTTDLEAEVNSAIKLFNNGENYTTGTGTLDVRVMYRIHDFS